MKKLIALLAAIPIAAFAQGGPPGGGPGPGRGQGRGPGPNGPAEAQAMQKRARLALTLGLATTLDLDDAQALRLSDTVGKFSERRRAIHEQVRDARQALRKAAQGEKVAAADVDQAIAKILDGRAQIQALDRELVTTVTKDLSPEKKARAVLFLSRFERRFGRGGPGMHGPGMHMQPGMMRGPGGPGMRGGPTTGMEMGPMGPGAMAGGSNGPDDWDDE
ncbi:MAG TPA: hypothetical protein VFK90_13380 [Anaeromyxobacter sp.]|nr:hypothetical protein [Anaeromyxobacter sp.]